MVENGLNPSFGAPTETPFGDPLPRLELTWDMHPVLAGITTRELDFRSGGTGAREALKALEGWAIPRFHSVVSASQAHGTGLFRADEVPPGVTHVDGRDGFLVANSGILLTVSVADCVPALIYAPSHRAAALLHAGWRGVAAGIMSAAVAALADEYDVGPSECLAYLGPAIGPCCYPVGEEVVESIRATEAGSNTDKWLARDRDGPRIDLRAALTRQAVCLGLSPRSVVSSPTCTCCDGTRFHSHRRDRAASGRMVFFAGFPE